MQIEIHYFEKIFYSKIIISTNISKKVILLKISGVLYMKTLRIILFSLLEIFYNEKYLDVFHNIYFK